MAKDTTSDQPTAGPSSTPRPFEIPKLSGMNPGLLDATQVQRLCRRPGSTLSFASFDPYTASSHQEVPDFRNLSLNEELYRPKRIVVETLPTGESTWRFVPSARRDEGVVDEGAWPRAVEICGKLYHCSQEQWDIYKLDPLYDCYVRAYPHMTIISRVATKPVPSPQPAFGSKRPAMLSPTPERPGPSRPAHPRKKVHGFMVESSSSEDEESEVEEMVIDDTGRLHRARSLGLGDRAKKHREEKERNRRDRREKMARRQEQLGGHGTQQSYFSFTGDQPNGSGEIPITPESSGKRKVQSVFESLRTNGDPDHVWPEDEFLRNGKTYTSNNTKRARTLSPASAKRALDASRLLREKQKRERREQELNARRQARDSQFLNELFIDIPEDIPDASQGSAVEMESASDYEAEDDNQYSDDVVIDEEAAHQAAIEESRRKLAELNADKPLWEAEAAKRRQREWAEEEARRAKIEAQRRAEAELREREKRQREEAERKAREEAAQKDRENQERREWEKRRRSSWLYGKWSQQRAMERYLELSKVFDETKYSPQEPLTADAVPWPVLQSPRTFTMEDVTWQAVEEFFEVVKSKMRSQDFKTLVEKSHRRFHPDRWRSRSLLTSVADEAERGCMEVAANTVAQALTPMWQRLRAAGR
ncbi:hypothetical protein Hypma_002622 [Hypsizygus marmoreus]|uniref:Uncharacterized protein n=1 Tax=Hypsizygus marmoreus TaxID=39966 RepID=A0A369J440_HYPMA|nr:hypothetical protein Hypma_002622 [Hypsizygus marmoreus]